MVTTHHTQMVWPRHCLFDVGKQLQCGGYPLHQVVATLDPFQGLQAQVIFASLVSEVLGIMTYVCTANTVTIRAQFELHLFGRSTQWRARPTLEAWIKTRSAVQKEAGSATSMETLPLAGGFREVGTCPDVVQWTILWWEGAQVGH